MGPGVGPSSSAGHIQDLAGGSGSPQRQLQYSSDPAASPVHSHSYAQQVRPVLSLVGINRDSVFSLVGICHIH